MPQYLVTTVDTETSPKTLIIDTYTERIATHIAKHHRVSYYYPYTLSSTSSTRSRVAKVENLAIINMPPFIGRQQQSNVIKSIPFTTYGLNLKVIDLHSAYPELFL